MKVFNMPFLSSKNIPKIRVGSEDEKLRSYEVALLFYLLIFSTSYLLNFVF